VKQAVEASPVVRQKVSRDRLLPTLAMMNSGVVSLGWSHA